MSGQQKEYSYLVKDKANNKQYITNKVGKGLIVSIIEKDLSYVTAALASSSEIDVTSKAMPEAATPQVTKGGIFKTRFVRGSREQTEVSHKLFVLSDVAAETIGAALKNPDFLSLAQANNAVCYVCEYKAPKKNGDIQIKVIPTKK